MLYGFLNVTLYLGAFVLAMKQVAAGIGTLSLAINPLFISILSAFWLGRTVQPREWVGLFICLMGVTLATYPRLHDAQATPLGMAILLLSMLAYSVGTVYYARQRWDLPLLVINGWQVLFGGIFMLPLVFIFSDFSAQVWDIRFWGAVWWLVIPVSVGAVQLWLYLLRQDPVRASWWLFLCPIFGFLYAYLFMDEPISWHTVIGTALVLGGLYWGNQAQKK
jgi:drug/metabolite transporter (DMT)-like permease